MNKFTVLPITPNYKPYYINFSLLIFSIGLLFKVSAAPIKIFRKYLIRVILLNSREALKFLISNSSVKVTYGWTNYSWKVISQTIIEIWMGYRGSKSVGWLTRIGWYYWKEQRIYSGTYKKISIFYIRYILTDFERNCQIINLFYQRNKQNKLYSLYATELLNNGQDPNKENLSWFICGLVKQKEVLLSLHIETEKIG